MTTTLDTPAAATPAPAPPTTTAAAALPSQVDCPLCGYDQAGAIASFAPDSSPMTGRCPECGLDWFWGDLLHPGKQLPRWFAENPRRFAPAVLFATRRRALRPRRFWSEVLLTFPIRRGRLALFVLLSLILAYLIAGIASAANVYVWGRGGWSTTGTLSLEMEALLAAALPFGRGGKYDVRALNHWSLLVLMWCVMMPLPFLVMRETFTRIRIRHIHLLRIAAYSMVALPLLVLLMGAVRFAAILLMQFAPAWQSGRSSQQSLWAFTYFLLTVDWLVVIAAALWLGFFWHRAITIYLRLPNARAVVVLMLIASFLGALTFAAYFPGSNLTQAVGDWLVW